MGEFIDQRRPEDHARSYLPGLGKTWLNPLYDFMSRVSGLSRAHSALVRQASIAPRQQVVDVGAGTGNLAFAVLAAVPDAQVHGVDPDSSALRIAARKARRRRVPLTLHRGYADQLPFDDASVDHVVSALAVHHLDADARQQFFTEAARIVAPSGGLHVVDLAATDPHWRVGIKHAGDHRGGHSHRKGHSNDHSHDHSNGHSDGHSHGHRNGHGPVGGSGPTDGVEGQTAGGNGLIPTLEQLVSEAGFSNVRVVDGIDKQGRLISVHASI